MAVDLPCTAESPGADGRGTGLDRLGAGEAPGGGGPSLGSEDSGAAELLGDRAAAVPGGPGLGDADILAAAVPDHGAAQTLSVTVITMSSDLFPRNQVATVAGMGGTFGNAGLLLFSLLIGGLVSKIGYTPFFVCLGVFDEGTDIYWARSRTLEY